jgi:tetratricopeptide (TPR) repeat protein
MKKRFFAVLVLIFAAAWCFGQTNFARGEDLFMHNKPEEAVSCLENAIAEDTAHVKAFLYLGIVYEQMDKTDDAITVYRRILDRAGDLTAYVANNLGNVYYKTGSTAEAESLYTQALEADRVHASAYLGRANARLTNGSLRDAVADYEQYLLLKPRDPQKEVIEELVAYIKSEFTETEEQQIPEEVSAGPDQDIEAEVYIEGYTDE